MLEQDRTNCTLLVGRPGFGTFRDPSSGSRTKSARQGENICATRGGGMGDKPMIAVKPVTSVFESYDSRTDVETDFSRAATRVSRCRSHGAYRGQQVGSEVL